MRGALRLAVLVVGAQSAANEPFVFREPESPACKAISSGVAPGVLLGAVKQRDGGPIPNTKIESFSLTSDGGLRVRCLDSEMSSTRADSEGQFFLPLPNGRHRCIVLVGAAEFEQQKTTVECGARTCVEVTLDRSDSGE